MAYWWVSQNKTFKQERDGGYMWAPKVDAAGARPHHWETMTEVRSGDVIFSYAQGAIGAIGVATSAAYDANKPAEFGAVWQQDGRRVDVDYKELRPAYLLSAFVEDLYPLLSERFSPLNTNRTGNQGYLFRIPPEAGRLLCQRLGAPVDEIVEHVIERAVLDKTDREALVKSRIGQGRWRKDLLVQWSGKCAVTGLSVEPLLRASHIKPWRDSDNRERLDVFNGLLLGAAYDAAFDAGLIAFAPDGQIIVSTVLSDDQRTAAGLNPTVKLRSIADRHQNYLAYHRTTVFGKVPSPPS